MVVGGGPAGLSAARAYREAGGEATVTLLTAEPHAPYERPPLTKGYLRGESDRDALTLEPPAFFAERRVALRTGSRVAALDVERGVVSLDSGEELSYDACVLATGSEPQRPPVPGADGPDLLTMRTLDDADRLRARIGRGLHAVVVGSGFVGCEAAASLAASGSDVTLVTREARPHEARLGAEVGELLTGWLEEAGVGVRLGAEVERIESGDVLLEGDERLAADVVLLATGVKPRVELANAAGLTVEGGALATDARLEVVPGVFAAGDIALAVNTAAGRRIRVEHWGDALAQGEVVGLALAGRAAAWDAVPGFWSTIGSHTVKHAAWGDGWDEVRLDLDPGDGALTAWYGREGRTVGVLTHERDEDYERGRERVERGDPLS